QPAVLHALPQLYFRNTWTWHCTDEGCTARPSLKLRGDSVATHHESLKNFWFTGNTMGEPNAWSWLFTDNETNADRHPGLPSESEYYTDAFHNYVVLGDTKAVNPAQSGTKCGFYGLVMIPAGETRVMQLRLTETTEPLAQEAC